MVIFWVMLVMLLAAVAMWAASNREATLNADAVLQISEDARLLRKALKAAEETKAENERVYEEEFRNLSRLLGADYRQMQADRNHIIHLEGENSLLKWQAELVGSPEPLAIDAPSRPGLDAYGRPSLAPEHTIESTDTDPPAF